MDILLNDFPDKKDEINEDPSSVPTSDAVEEDGTPVLDEEDLEENDLSVEEADEIEWEDPKANKGSSGDEEKDITD
jgi:ribose 5-phosphate isomerase